MKRIQFLQVFIILALMMALASSCKKDDDLPPGRKLFDITVPAGWLYQYYYDENLLLYAWSPLRIEDDEAMLQDTINEDLLLTRQHLPGTDLAGFFNSVTNLLDQDTSFHYVYVSDTVINGEDAKKLIHLQTYKIASRTIPTDSVYLQVKPMKLIFFKDEYGYILDCGMLPYTYPHYKPLFDDFISTFQFKN